MGSALAFLLIPGLIVFAHHLPFTDVPASGDLHDAVGAIYGAGVTAGTTATTYSPDNPVTRGQMAFFLHRSLGRVVYDSLFNTGIPLTASEQDLVVVTINTGGVPGAPALSSWTETSRPTPTTRPDAHVALSTGLPKITTVFRTSPASHSTTALAPLATVTRQVA